MVVVKDAFGRHGIYSVIFDYKPQELGEPQFYAVRFFERDSEKFLKIAGVNFCAVRGPE